MPHDDCGRLIERRVERDGFKPQRWRYRWDVHDRLMGVTTLEGEEWLFHYDPFGRRVCKVRRFAEQDRHRAVLRWSSLIGGEGVPRPSRSGSDAQTRDHGLPDVGTAYLWDGDHMVAEAPLFLDGHIAWNEQPTGSLRRAAIGCWPSTPLRGNTGDRQRPPRHP